MLGMGPGRSALTSSSSLAAPPPPWPNYHPQSSRDERKHQKRRDFHQKARRFNRGGGVGVLLLPPPQTPPHFLLPRTQNTSDYPQKEEGAGLSAGGVSGRGGGGKMATKMAAVGWPSNWVGAQDGCQRRLQPMGFKMMEQDGHL